MISLEIRNQMGRYGIYERNYNGVEVDRTLHVRLTESQANAICGSHTGIYMGNTSHNAEAESVGLYVKKVQDRAPLTRAWELYAGDEKICRVSDDFVHLLQEHANVTFEPDQPDWDLRAIEEMDDLIFSAQEKLEKLKLRRDAVALEYEQARTPEHSPEP